MWKDPTAPWWSVSTTCCAATTSRQTVAAAEQPVEALASSVLPQMSADLQGLLEIIDRVNDDEMDDPILYAVSYLLRAAKRFSDAAPQA